MSRQLEVYEVEYSCSPGGVDRWEITEAGSFLAGDFDNAEEAIAYALMEFEGQELNLNIKSLKWYHDNQKLRPEEDDLVKMKEEEEGNE